MSHVEDLDQRILTVLADDGRKSFTDLGMLATNWQRQLAAPSAPQASASGSAAPFSSRRTPRAIDQLASDLQMSHDPTT